MFNLTPPFYQKIKWVVITLLAIIILITVLTNNKSTELNFINIVAIWFFSTSYIFPYFEKKDMYGGISSLACNEENLIPRFFFMIFGLFVCILNLYLLLK